MFLPRLVAPVVFLAVAVAPAAAGDRELSQRVLAALSACELDAGSQLRVGSSSGVVSLGGFVRTLRERECVAVEAERVPGVRFLRPSVVVRPSEPIGDAELIERVRAVLRDGAGFQGPAPIQVAAEAGRVRLAGEVRVPDDKYRAEDAVRRVEGVLELDNAIHVDPEKGARSMEVQLSELFRVRDVPVTDLRVIEEEGRVIISGRSHDVVAQRLAEEYVRQLPGGKLVATRIHLVLRPPVTKNGS